MPARCSKPRVATTEAESDREDRVTARIAKMGYRGGRVGLDAVLGCLLDVRHVLEIVVPFGDSRRPSKVVDRHCCVPTLGEEQRDLLVETVEPPDIGEDHDADACRLVRCRREGREAVAVSRLEHEVVVGDRGARDRRYRR